MPEREIKRPESDPNQKDGEVQTIDDFTEDQSMMCSSDSSQAQPRGFIRTSDPIDVFYDFIKFSTVQANRDWGTSLNLASLNEIIADTALRYFASEMIKSPNQETFKLAFHMLIGMISQKCSWIVPNPMMNVHPVTGRHDDYGATGDVQEPKFVYARGSSTDRLMSRNKTRRILLHWTHGIQSVANAFSESAVIEMLRGYDANIGLVVDGTRFLIHWFVSDEPKAMPMQKLREFIAFDTVDALIEFTAHIAFFVADPLSQNIAPGPKQGNMDF